MGVRTEIDAGLGWLILDRPERAHAYDRAHLDALLSGIRQLEAEVGIAIVASTGEGAFCGGADLDEVRARSVDDVLDLRSQAVFEALACSPMVTLAAVQGPAVGGGFELALACDFRVVGPKATFQFPELGLGLVPAAGGLTRVERLVGPARTKELVWLQKTLDAPTAVAWGVASVLVADARTGAADWGRSLLAVDPGALRISKELLAAGPTLLGERLAQALLTARARKAT